MKRKHHITYSSLIFLIVVAFVIVEIIQTQNFNNTLSTEVSKLNQEINLLKQTDTNLEEQLGTTKTSVNKLSDSLIEKETQIAGLTGELKQVKIDNQNQIINLENQVTKLKAQNEDFSDIIEQAIPSVVSIRTNLGSGSGFLIRDDGYIVTNYHVIKGVSAATIVTSNGDTHSVMLIDSNPSADISILKIKGTNHPFFRFANSNNVNVGEKVIAVGNPGGLDFSVTQGIISAVNRIDETGTSFIQIDVPINPGNSGGPLINTEGKVVGVNTKKIAGFEGLGFAIESNLVNKLANDFISAYKNSLN